MKRFVSFHPNWKSFQFAPLLRSVIVPQGNGLVQCYVCMLQDDDTDWFRAAHEVREKDGWLHPGPSACKRHKKNCNNLRPQEVREMKIKIGRLARADLSRELARVSSGPQSELPSGNRPARAGPY